MNFCAFLRGVNVKGTAMKMAEVCSVFERAEMENISSVLATGNILFSSEKSVKELKPILEETVSQHFDHEAFLFIKNKEEIFRIYKNNPFEKRADFHNYVFIGIDGIENTLMTEFSKCKKAESEKANIIENVFYWQVAKGNTLDSEFGKILGKKSLKDAFTSRNLNTFEKILKKLNIEI